MTSPYSEERFRTRDRACAEEWLSARFGRVSVGPDFGGLETRVSGDHSFVLADSRSEGRCRFAVLPSMTVVVSSTPGVGWELPDECGSASVEPALFARGEEFTAIRGESESECVGFDHLRLRRTARLAYGRSDLDVRFDGPRPASARGGASWLAALELARQDAASGLLGNDLIRAGTFRFLAVAVLASFRLIGDRNDLRASAERSVQVYRAGAAFLHDNASLPITIDDAAEASAASVRELVVAFQSHSAGEQGPTAFLRLVRLTAAHDELEAGTRETVGAVAERWGFRSEASFVLQHRHEYGVAPRE